MAIATVYSLQEYIDKAARELKISKVSIVRTNQVDQLMKSKMIPNACVTPLTNTIYVNDAFCNTLTVEEQVAVCLHELGHLYHGHVTTRLAIKGVGFATSIAVWFLPMSFFHKVLTQIGLTVAETVGTSVLAKQQEYQADAVTRAFKMNGHLASALTKIKGLLVLEHGEPAWYNKALAFVAGTHPELDDRIKKLQ